MSFVRCLVCACVLLVGGATFVGVGVGVAHANQVQEPPPPPPPPPPPATTPAPATATPEKPAPEPPAPTPESSAPVPTPRAPEPTRVTPAPPDSGAQGSAGGGTQVNVFDVNSGSPETHAGFFLRLALGLGFQTWAKQLPAEPPEGSRFPVGGGEATFSGAGIGAELAVGYVVVPNLALHATMFGTGLGNPTLTVADVELPDADGRAFLATCLGLGATYYFMPINVYVSASFGLGGMRMVPVKNAKAIDTKAGFAWELIAGKEWWVADDWGLGAALQLLHVNVPDEGKRSAALAVNALFTATYN